MEKKGTNSRFIGPLSLAVSGELRAELARKGLNVHQFALKSGLPLSTLHKTLKGQRVVDVEDLGSICSALDVSPARVLATAMDAARFVAISNKTLSHQSENTNVSTIVNNPVIEFPGNKNATLQDQELPAVAKETPTIDVNEEDYT